MWYKRNPLQDKKWFAYLLQSKQLNLTYILAICSSGWYVVTGFRLHGPLQKG